MKITLSFIFLYNVFQILEITYCCNEFDFLFIFDFSKWKPTKYDKNAEVCHYLLKVEALSLYWNSNSNLKKWDLPSQYYQWRNAMATSFQNYSYNNEEFNFGKSVIPCRQFLDVFNSFSAYFTSHLLLTRKSNIP